MRISETKEGFLDLDELETQLLAHKGSGAQLIGCFSAASNITGILADDVATTLLLHQHGALAFWDYATAGEKFAKHAYFARSWLRARLVPFPRVTWRRRSLTDGTAPVSSLWSSQVGPDVMRKFGHSGMPIMAMVMRRLGCLKLVKVWETFLGPVKSDSLLVCAKR